jgi:hypothetical protein
MSSEIIYPLEDWWMDDQKELVEDNSRNWSKKTFKMVPGFWIQKDGYKVLGKVSDHEELPPDTILDNTAWDHEHCDLCHETISEHESYQHEGYTDGKDWICIECFDKYIAPRRNRPKGAASS